MDVPEQQIDDDATAADHGGAAPRANPPARRATAGRARAKRPAAPRVRRTPEPVPTHAVKALVAVVDDAFADPFDAPATWGRQGDDEPVGIPAPCARLRAGYWCSCGGDFRSLIGRMSLTRARVAVVQMPVGADRVTYLDADPYDDRESLVPRPEPWELDHLAATLDALDVGTVVERRGLGFAPLFRPAAQHGPVGFRTYASRVGDAVDSGGWAW